MKSKKDASLLRRIALVSLYTCGTSDMNNLYSVIGSNLSFGPCPVLSGIAQDRKTTRGPYTELTRAAEKDDYQNCMPSPTPKVKAQKTDAPVKF